MLNKKNLLAFSGGVDSSALFFMLLERGIPFDLAIVNYHTRDSSDLEVEYAKELGNKYNKKVFVEDCFLSGGNFEMEARNCRYNFFETIIKKDNYETLILAHQLNDKFEWFLMQFSKGAGLKELLSFEKEVKKDGYTIYRPLIEISREEIEEYLENNNIKYFVDETNSDIKYKRNYFRKEFATKFLKEFSDGVKRSFKYLEEDKELLFKEDWIYENGVYKFKIIEPKIDIKKVDLILKRMGYILSNSQRKEIIKQNFSIIIGGKIAIDKNDEFIFISPYIKLDIDKNIREEFRINKIPPKLRGFLYQNSLKVL